jgi:hypothetical protein
MSTGPLQNVYFYNPASLSYLNTSINVCQNQLGYGQTLSSTGSTAVQNYLQTYAYGDQPVPILFGQGVNDAPFRNGFVGFGNINTNQEYLFSTGPANESGISFSTTESVYNPFSVGKLLLGLVCGKMIEERLIKSTTRLVEIDPSIFTGTAQYYTKITPIAPASFPFPGSYTAETGAYDLTELTIGDCLKMNIGALQSIYGIPVTSIQFTPLYSTGTTSLIGNLGELASVADKALLIQSLTILFSTFNGTPLGPETKAYLGQSFTPENAIPNMIATYFTLFRNGTMPLAYKPNEKSVPNFPYAIRADSSTYSFSYQVLAYCLDKRLRNLHSLNPVRYPYHNFSEYARAKFFNPLGMDKTYVIFQDTIPQSQYLGTQSWRRNIPLGECYFNSSFSPQGFNIADPTTWTRFGCSTGYSNDCYSETLLFVGSTGVLGSPAGPMVWSTQSTYADDGLSKSSKYYNYTGTASINGVLDGSAPLMSTVSDLSKLIKLMCNRGIAPANTPSAGQRLIKTETWNYILSSKISSISGVNDTTDFSNIYNLINNSAYGIGIYRLNRDLSNITTYGFDSSSCWLFGLGNDIFLFDYYTGNWLFIGAVNHALSSGSFSIPDSIIDLINTGLKGANPDLYTIRKSQFGRDPTDENYLSSFLQRMIKN